MYPVLFDVLGIATDICGRHIKTQELMSNQLWMGFKVDSLVRKCVIEVAGVRDDFAAKGFETALCLT